MNLSDTAGHASIVKWTGTFLFLIGTVCLLLVLILLNTAERMAYREPPALDYLPGLEVEVEVVRDGSGTWHILGENWEDVLRAQGWMHAQERMWQMELGRLAGRGRLSELFGALALPADRVMRTLGLDRAAEKQVVGLPQDVRERLQAYADGVSAWLASDSCRLPLELVLLGWEPEPWSLEDSAIQIGLMGLTLSSNWAQEAVRASLEARFSTKDVALLMPDFDKEAFIAATSTLEEIDRGNARPDIHAAWKQWALLAGGISSLREFLGLPTGGVGSNAWAVSGDRTRSGKPLLANDPHLGVQIPSLWIAEGLHIPGRDLVGVSLPGLPSVIIGRTNAFAWGFTNTMADNQDLYIERPVEDDPDSYWFMDRQIPYEVRREIIQVRRAEPETLTVRSTLHGPVINNVLTRMLHGTEEVVDVIEGGGSGVSDQANSQNVDDWVEVSPPITLRWVTLEGGGELISLARILEARDWHDIRELFTTFLSPGQNVIYADTTGSIAWQFTGAIPVRHGWDGSLPVPGWTGQYEWDGYVPFDDLPRAEDPDSGL
ncbi:penicillin acylase family protein, partial [Gemmatimonadota bacterium]